MTNLANNTNNVTTMESIKNKNSGNDMSRSPFEAVNLVLSDIGTNSENTKDSYLRAMSDFVEYAFDKNLGTVEWFELESVTYDMALSFREHMRTIKDSKDRRRNRLHPRTINHKMFALNSTFRKLNKVNAKINTNAFDTTPLKFNDEEGSYGSLTEDEVNKLFDYCLGLPESQKPIVKQLFFEVAYVTAIRSGALMKATWKNLLKVKDYSSDRVYNVIKVQDKGSNIEVPITDELYNRLILLKELNKELGVDEERIFPITRKTLSKCLKDFCEEEGISENRNIVLHSLKKASIDKVYKETGDINATARHGHHKGIEMVYKHYQGKNEGLANSPSLTIFNEDVKDIGELEGLSKEELLKVIENCSGYIVNNIIKTKKEVIG